MSAKVFVTMNVHVQLKAVATDAADPLILPGKISPSISPAKNNHNELKCKLYSHLFSDVHGIGPIPDENPMT